MKKLFLLLLLFMQTILLKSQTNQQVKNLEAFAKVYGYVKYFHPSDEASKIDWNKFSAYGAEQILKCNSTEDLVRTLDQLFKPIAPSIVISLGTHAASYDILKITPEIKSAYYLTFWQHFGLGVDTKSMIYKSTKVNKTKKNDNSIFDLTPAFGTLINKQITQNVICQIPLVLYSNAVGTYPLASKEEFQALDFILNNYKPEETSLAFSLGNVINIYNVFQHFYPYFKEVDVDWLKEFDIAIKRSFEDKTKADHIVTIEKFTAKLKDGHIVVYSSEMPVFRPSFFWDWVEEKLIITDVYGDENRIKVGDEISKINGKSTKDFFAEVKSKISAGNESSLNFWSIRASLLGQKNTIMDLTVNGKDLSFEREFHFSIGNQYLKSKKLKVKEISEAVYYLNLDLVSMTQINLLMPKIKKRKSIICDMSGYPKGNHAFIAHLLKSDDTSSAWMKIPQIIYPDDDAKNSSDGEGWLIKAKKPYLGDKQIIFIIDGRAVSYAESFMSFIEAYKLAIIIGQPTAGTNGNVNAFKILGDINIRFTGMKVVKHDGSQHHGIGILPNRYLNKTVEGVKSGRDEFLEKAIEMTKAN